MQDSDVTGAYQPLYDLLRASDQALTEPPLLAHYTSIGVLRSILETGQIWFSNPLLMNDIEEMRFGLNEGSRIFSDKTLLTEAARGDQGKALALESAFVGYNMKFQSESAFDVYVFCLSEHDHSNYDGILSMWRGYGGQGKGAALVFDPKKIVMVPGSPLIIARVRYATGEDRSIELEVLMKKWVAVTKSLDLTETQLHLPAYYAFSAFLTYALITKHIGFAEEREWRVIYIAENDKANLLKSYLGVHLTSRGAEPKLKYKVGYIQSVSAPDLALDRLVERIILGPSMSSPLAVRGVQRMLETIGKADFSKRVFASSIPFSR